MVMLEMLSHVTPALCHRSGRRRMGADPAPPARLGYVSRDVILVPSRPLSFPDALRPPREEGGGADALRLALQSDAARGLGVFEVVNRGEMPIGQRGVGQWPQMLRRLEFGGVGGQEEQVDVVGHAQLHAGMPSGAVEHQHDLFARTRADLARESRQFHFEERDGDRGREMEDRATRGRMDKV
jgi:hypothetical protein